MNKQIKRLLSLVTVVAMLFAITACGEDKEQKAIDKVNAAFAKTAEADANGIDADLTIDAKGKLDGKDEEISADMSIKLNMPEDKKDIKKMEMAMPMKLKVSGQDVNMNLYVKNGWVYTNLMGLKSKAPLEEDEYFKIFTETGDDTLEIKKEYVDSAKIDGDKVIIDFNLAKLIASLEEEDDDIDAEDIKEAEEQIEKFTVEFDIQDDVIKGMKGDFKYVGDNDDDEEDDADDLTVTFELKLNKIGDIGNIKFPKDLNTYVSGDAWD